MFDLTGARVLIIGGSSGIGYAAADALIKAGGTVTIASQNADRLAKAAAALGCEHRQLDVTNDAAVEAFFAATGSWQHVLVSIAPGRAGPVRTTSPCEAESAMNAKFWSAVRVARYAQIDPAGSLTFIGGQVGKRPNPGMVLLGAINAALEGLARGLALELSPVRVNVVAPGLIDTPLHSGMPDEVRTEMFRNVAERLPVKRIGAAEDVAQGILYIICNGFSSATALRVDGGSMVV